MTAWGQALYDLERKPFPEARVDGEDAVAKEGTSTGGQINVAGILYQMLVSLADGIETTVSAHAFTSASPVVLQVEPFDGGDVQITATQRLVIQIKTRVHHRRWTSGAIISDVLPDLFRAVGPRADDRYQFVTDNDAGCEDFRRFLRWFRARQTAPDTPSETFRLGKGGKQVSAETLLEAVASKLDPDGTKKVRVDQLLGALEIVRRNKFDLVRTIHRCLEPLVERPEDIRHKRKQLIGELVELGAGGARVTTSELLDKADLDPRRLLLKSWLPQLLYRKLATFAKALNYDREKDVRAALAPPRRPMTVLRGESGLGKSWRLCALAMTMAAEGKLVVLVRATADVDALRARIATTIWNPIYSNLAPLSSIAERLRPKFADARGVWLTVFLDDLNDPELARRIVDDDWAGLGIDVVASCQTPTADWLSHSAAAPEIVDVPAFNIEELVRYLEAHGVDYDALADDVFELLFKPVLARLFCLLPRGISLRAETEYELMNSFWSLAARERPNQIRHPFDLDRLQLVIADMLTAPATYPWPPSSFVRTIDDAAVFRLMECGIVELDGERRLSMTHDRLLNWATAAHLASHAVDQNLPASELVLLVERIDSLETVSGVRIGGRLGYVLLDLLWLSLGPGRRTPAQVAEFLLAYMRRPDFDRYDHDFFRKSLPTLGSRAVPLLQAMAETPLAGERESFWPAWIAEALRNVANDAWDDVRAAAVALFRSGDEARAEIALRVMTKVGAGELVEDLFQLNMRRKADLDGAAGNDRLDVIQAKERAFAAFARSVEQEPAWLDRKIANVAVRSQAEQLLWALLRLDRRAALPIWRHHREHLFAVIGPGCRVLPRAIRTFAEPEDRTRLHLPSPEGAEHLHGAVTLDAIARLDPAGAVNILASGLGRSQGLDLWGTENWWMPGLHHRAGAALTAALRGRAERGGRIGVGTRLAQRYGSSTEFIDAEAVDLILDDLELLASDTAIPREDRLNRAYQPLRTLSSLQTLATLDRVAGRRGSRLERVLADFAIDRPPRDSRNVDHEGEMIAHLLAVMGGEGYDRLVLAQITSSGRTTAEYGFRHALWTSTNAIGLELERLAVERQGGDDQDQPYYLMQALASHGRDAGLARLVEDRTPVYTHAVDIRQARQGDAGGLSEQIRARVASGDPDEQVRALDMSHFLDGDLALDLTRPLIASAAPGGPVASALLTQHFHRSRYDPSLLPKIEPFLGSANETATLAALHLALHGDATGRAGATAWLGAHGLQDPQWRAVQAALALLDHEDSRQDAIHFLRRYRDRNRYFDHFNADVLDALANHGDQDAAEQLANLAFGGKARDESAVANAVRMVARRNAPGAFRAARRLFVRSGRLEAARLLMDTDPARAVAELMAAYVGANLPRRLAIARTLRWGAPRDMLLPALAVLALSPEAVERQMAAEIAGWLPHSDALAWLEALSLDPVQAVEEAALAALLRRAANAEGQALLGALAHQPKPRQWAYLHVIIDNIDPHLLVHTKDSLAIRPALASLPEEFAIEAQRLINRRRQELERKEAALARKEE